MNTASAHLVLLLCGVMGLVAGATPARAQGLSLTVELGVEPLEVTVGDPFRSVARISAPPGHTVRYFDIPDGDSITSLRPLTVVEDASGNAIAVYTLAAWATGDELRAPARIEVTAPDGSIRVQEVRLRLPLVRSVLPEDTAGVTPRPPKGLVTPLETNRFPWWWLLLLLLAAALWLAYYLWRRRGDESAIPVDPRHWALQQLSDDHLRTAAPPDDRPWLVDHVSRVVREYISLTRKGLSRDLTTSEILQRLGPAGRRIGEPPPADREGEREQAVTALALILGPADKVKFARYAPSGSEAADLLERAREWVARYPSPAAAENPRRAA